MNDYCHQCGEPFTIDENGIATHYDGHDLDADHVPYSLDSEV